MTTKIRVIHSHRVWLTHTMTWLHAQLTHTDTSKVTNYICCELRKNEQEFNTANIFSLSDNSIAYRFIHKLLRFISLETLNFHLISALKQNKIEILHSHFGDTGWRNQSAAKILSIPHVVTFYGYDVSRLPQSVRWVKRYLTLFQNVTVILCEGPHMAKQLIALGCPEHKVLVHHLGIELEKFPFQPRQIKNNSPLKVLIAARFTEKKGIPYAIAALGEIKNKIPLEITIVGSNLDDAEGINELKLIKSAISDANLGNITTLQGSQTYSELITTAYNHHVYISPSITAKSGDTEGGAPVSIIEMIATGMPVISTNHCDIPNVLNYDDNDWLVPEKDVHALSHRILWLYNNPEKWEAFLTTGRRRIETCFDAEKQGQKLTFLYSCLVSKENTPIKKCYEGMKET